MQGGNVVRVMERVVRQTVWPPSPGVERAALLLGLYQKQRFFMREGVPEGVYL